MARKEPFKRIMVSDRIYEAVAKKRSEESKEEFRPLPMNAYCEKILWDYAQGKLTREEPILATRDAHVVRSSVRVEEQGQSGHEEEEAPADPKNARKRGHR